MLAAPAWGPVIPCSTDTYHTCAARGCLGGLRPQQSRCSPASFSLESKRMKNARRLSGTPSRRSRVKQLPGGIRVGKVCVEAEVAECHSASRKGVRGPVGQAAQQALPATRQQQPSAAALPMQALSLRGPCKLLTAIFTLAGRESVQGT